MAAYFCLLGNFPDLSQLEIITLLERFQEPKTVKNRSSYLIEITLDKISPQSLMDQAGGLVKIYQAVDSVPADILANSSPRVCFSALDPKLDLKKQAQSVKNLCRQKGFSLGFRLLGKPTDSAGVLTALPEYVFLTEYTALKTVAVQNIDYWNFKDYQRPQVAPRAGMLPPKIARILVNLALPRPIGANTVVYDPFCGTGTILTEALDLGCTVVGSDLDPKAVAMTLKNLHWFTTQRQSSAPVTVFKANAQEPVAEVAPNSVDALVFEGYLGPPHPNPEHIDRYLRGLTKMYLGVFKHLRPLLKSNGRLVAALPAYVNGNSVKTLTTLIDRCEKLGYTPLVDPLWYYRAGAMIRRHLFIWKAR